VALWDQWKDRACPEQPIRSCTMIITEPNDFVEEVHDRMPALLKPEQFDDCLSGRMDATDSSRSTTIFCRDGRCRSA
jgi:putative SOS response-associated peptidase YedK